MSLDVYLSGKRIGALHRGAGSEYSFAYALEVVERVEPGTPLLSYSLPVRAEPYGPEEIRPYVEGLLPQGEQREQIARELEIFDAGDGYALIAELGRDCPGAVTFLPRGVTPEHADRDSVAWLDEDELEELVGEEPELLVDVDHEHRMRFALPGERHKLALVYDDQEDRWAWPAPGLPSTHIVKPQGDELDDLAANELACGLALREMGLPVAHAELHEIAGRTCLISKRFDRWGEGIAVERLHQESFCQALGYAPDDLGGDGPGYAESRALLEAIGEREAIEALFVASYSNFLIGNRNHVHGRDTALLYTPAGPMLAPFRAISSTSAYEDPATHYAIEEHVRRSSCLAALAPLGVECGYELQPGLSLATETIARLGRALGAVAGEAEEGGWYEPVIDVVLQRVIARFHSFRDEMEFLRPPSLGGQ